MKFRKTAISAITMVMIAALSTNLALAAPNDLAGGCKSNTAQFAYLTDMTNGAITYHQVNQSTGALSLPVATYPTQADALSTAFDEKSGTLYVAHRTSNAIFQFSVQNTGALAVKTPAMIATGNFPFHVIVDPAGRNAYTANIGSNLTGAGSGGNSQFEIAKTGQLTPLAVEATPGRTSHSVAITPSGRFVYVTDGNLDQVSQYSTGSKGELIPLDPPAAAVPSGSAPYFVVTDTRGRYAYVANVGPSVPVGASISQFSIGNKGQLTPLSPPTIDGGSRSGHVASHPGGRFIYSVASNEIRHYEIASNGALILKTRTDTGSLSPYPPVRIFVDPSGQYAYATFALSTLVAQYKILADGSLTANSPSTTNSSGLPYGMAFACAN